MKTTNKISEILVKAGYESTDNRSYFTKAINKVIGDGFISIQIQDKGRVWLGDDGTQKGKFNLVVRGYGKMSRFYISDLDSQNILSAVGSFVMKPVIAEKHIQSLCISENKIEPCRKCNGKGIIPLFHYYCGGLCFDCYGSKYMVVKSTISV